LSLEDADSLFAICIKSEVSTFLTEFTADPAVEQEKLSAYIKNIYSFYGFGLWGVYLKEDNRLIGRCGIELKELDQESIYELGYLIDPDFQRNGYGREIVTAVLDYSLNELAIPKITAFIAPENTPSLHLAKSVGMNKVGEYIKNRKKYYRYEIIGSAFFSSEAKELSWTVKETQNRNY
jgi:RimJ/RimL family protein N-acetyltransferase